MVGNNGEGSRPHGYDIKQMWYHSGQNANHTVYNACLASEKKNQKRIQKISSVRCIATHPELFHTVGQRYLELSSIVFYIAISQCQGLDSTWAKGGLKTSLGGRTKNIF